MTLFYQTQSWSSQPQVSDKTINLWRYIANKSNWRITQLQNGFYQTEYQDPHKEGNWNDVTRRETLEGAELAIDASISHYSKKIEFTNGPKVVKTFEQ